MLDKNTAYLVTPLQSFLTRAAPPAGSAPLASINWILFDETFSFVKGGYSLLNGSKNYKNHYSELQNKATTDCGYLYLYVTNQNNADEYPLMTG